MFYIKERKILARTGKTTSLVYEHTSVLLFLLEFQGFLCTGNLSTLIILTGFPLQNIQVFSNFTINNVFKISEDILCVLHTREKKKLARTSVEKEELNLISSYNTSHNTSYSLQTFYNIILTGEWEKQRRTLLRRKADFRISHEFILTYFNKKGYLRYSKVRMPFYYDYNPIEMEDDISQDSLICPAFSIQANINGVLPFLSVNTYLMWSNNYLYISSQSSPLLKLNASSQIIGCHHRGNEYMVFYMDKLNSLHSCTLSRGEESHQLIDSFVFDSIFIPKSFQCGTLCLIRNPYTYIELQQESKERGLTDKENGDMNFTKIFNSDTHKLIPISLTGIIFAIIIETKERDIQVPCLKGKDRNVIRCYLFDVKYSRIFKAFMIAANHFITLQYFQGNVILQTDKARYNISLEQIKNLHGQTRDLDNSIMCDNYKELNEFCLNRKEVSFANQILIVESYSCSSFKFQIRDQLFRNLTSYFITGYELSYMHHIKGISLSDFKITEEKLDNFYIDSDEYDEETIEFFDSSNEEDDEEVYYNNFTLDCELLRIFNISDVSSLSRYQLLIPSSQDYSIFILESNQSLNFNYYSVDKRLQNRIFEFIF